MRVGFIGLGSQGAPMARRIIDGGHPTTLWARRPESLEPFADTAATIVGSPTELAAASDLVCLCVVGDADVDELTGDKSGLLASMSPGGVIAVHSTVHPDTCRKLADRAAAHQVSVLDAPVSGGAPAAERGRLLVMVGGDDDVVERCRQVFETYADPVVHLGGVGSGQTAKLLNNLLFTANLATAATTMSLADALGVDVDRLTDVVSRSSGNSFALGALGGVGGLQRLAGIAGGLLRKDVGLIVDVAERAGANTGAVLDAADAALALMDHPR
ncbi:NAD(P)-dependent oxidoreductase [Mycobacterium sp. Marseille-P9652]|uniref:NAD(P)-dependent oxidoreductase n=1 Tax=Mycobacterium sp. Marseille-P9652 TaxID=2654950 RepID=UPI0012E829CB|nr:NAD(P)-dependent oxidoreductase [Mycobacterium sp. Marseille-P9652]